MIVIFTTAPTIEKAENLAEKLVEEKLAACVQILPKITSFYFWEDKIQRDTEHLLLIKTAEIKFAEVESFIKANHSYNVPEVVAIKADNVSADYSGWLNNYLK